MDIANPQAKIAEVVEASTTGFTAQCYELYQAPPFGSLVKTADPPIEIYGVIYDAATTSIDPGRRPVARGREETEEEGIYRTNPQLTKLFRTDFSALVVGHREQDEIHHYLPPRPARIHGFVYLCETEEVQQFSQSLNFLTLLLAAQGKAPVEELIAACLRHASQAHADRRAFLVAAGKELAAALSGELHRLNTILRRIQP